MTVSSTNTIPSTTIGRPNEAAGIINRQTSKCLSMTFTKNLLPGQDSASLALCTQSATEAEILILEMHRHAFTYNPSLKGMVPWLIIHIQIFRHTCSSKMSDTANKMGDAVLEIYSILNSQFRSTVDTPTACKLWLIKAQLACKIIDNNLPYQNITPREC